MLRRDAIAAAYSGTAIRRRYSPMGAMRMNTIFATESPGWKFTMIAIQAEVVIQVVRSYDVVRVQYY